MASFRHCSTALLLCATLALCACGGGGGASGSSGTPTPTPMPAPPPPPPPSPLFRTLANQPPVPMFFAMLLTDGTVMVQANPTGQPGESAGDFYRLTPDA